MVDLFVKLLLWFAHTVEKKRRKQTKEFLYNSGQSANIKFFNKSFAAIAQLPRTYLILITDKKNVLNYSDVVNSIRLVSTTSVSENILCLFIDVFASLSA